MTAEDRPLRIMIAHSAYRQRGGEDVVADQEAELLEQHGHAVLRFRRDNRDLDASRRLHTAVNTLWSIETISKLARDIHAFRPDLIHVHNTFPSLSPSLYWTAAKRRIPIVQTLHNFRLLCPQAMLLREGSVCEGCVGHIPWRAVVHRCYHDSAAQSAVVASMLTMHRLLGTYENKVTRYIALNEFCRRKFIEGGLPADRISVKANFADLPPPERGQFRNGALFVGRLAPEKGIETLQAAMALLPGRSIEIIGDGPAAAQLQRQPRLEVRGWLDPQALFATMRRKSYLVLPSLWYENSPRTLIEAFGCGLPVVASRLGALAELVEDGKTGLLFDPNSPSDLARIMRWADGHPAEMAAMGDAARRTFEDLYTPERNYRELAEIYRLTIDSTRTAEAA